MATGAAPFVPPVPGLRELEGVWGTREATSMILFRAACWCWVVGPQVSSWRRSCGVSAARRSFSRALTGSSPRAGAAGRGAGRGPAPDVCGADARPARRAHAGS